MRSKTPELIEALTGRFTEHHAFLARVHLDLIDQHTRAIEELTARIEVVMEPFRGARDLIITIPGISVLVADVIIAETDADMSRFPTAGHPASWTGTCPSSSESAGRIKSTKARPGNLASRAPSGSRRCQPLAATTPTWQRSTNASPPDADRSEPSSPSYTRCSSRSGT